MSEPETPSPNPPRRGPGNWKGSKRGRYKRHGHGGCCFWIDGAACTEEELRTFWKENRGKLEFYWHATEGVVTAHRWTGIRGVKIRTAQSLMAAARFKRHQFRGQGAKKPRDTPPIPIPNPPNIEGVTHVTTEHLPVFL